MAAPAEPGSAAVASPAAPVPAAAPSPVAPAREDTAGSTELEQKAREVLEAWRARDLAALAKHATAHNQKMLAELKPGSSRYESILGAQSGRMKAVVAWDGRIRECRYRARRARCAFAEPSGDELMVITFEREDDRWAFEDMHSPSRADWEAWSQRPAPETPDGVKPSYVDCKTVQPGMPCTPDTPAMPIER